ncbi:hypothetical protein F4802DRAFT_561159 [Xylaria palmicola]|nr:hypothetical protein F4802DRAFT_561159 [Xylaria palmicola]
MEPPSKRPRLDAPYGADDDNENQDELAMTPAQFDATQDPMYQLDKGRAKAATRLKSTFEDIFEKYGKDFDGDDDVINFYTDEIEIDNGHVDSIESRKDGAAEDSLSSDEEERILSGKSGDKGKGALVPAAHKKFGRNQSPQGQSPWYMPSGLGTYRLSSMSFSSSPYGVRPPFEFGSPSFGNGPIDPTWQVPDLPVQPPYHQHRSLVGGGGNPFGQIDRQTHHAARRTVTTKSFLCNATTSEANNANTDEEDDIILGMDRQHKVLQPRPNGIENTPMPTGSKPDSRPSQSPVQHASSHKTNIAKNKLPKNSPASQKESIHENVTRPAVTDVILAPHQQAKENNQSHRSVGGSRSSPPARRKRGRPKQCDLSEPAMSMEKEPENATHPLRPNERRIEVIIPMMKSLLPSETEPRQGEELVVPAVEEIPQAPNVEQNVSLHENLVNSNPKNSDVMTYQPFTNLTEDAQDTDVLSLAQTSGSPISPTGQGSQKRSSSQIQAEIDSSTPDVVPYGEQDLGIACVEPNPSSDFSESVLDNFVDCYTDSLHPIEHKSDYSDGIERATPGRGSSSTTSIAADKEQTAHNTMLEENTKAMLVDKHNSEVALVLSSSPTEVSSRHAIGDVAKISTPPIMEAIPSEKAMSEEVEGSHYENEDVSQEKPVGLSIDPDEEELLARRQDISSNTTASYHDIQLDVPDDSEVANAMSEEDVRFQNPKEPAILESIESNLQMDLDCSSPTSVAPNICQEKDKDMPDRSLFAGGLEAEIDGLHLDSGRPDAQRSPSLGATELPDHDLSAFPAVSDCYSSRELVPRPSSPTPQTDARNITGAGRSPSPELGAPIGPEILPDAASQSKGSPTSATPTKTRGPRSAKPRRSQRRTPSTKRFPLTSLVSGSIEDESDDELSTAGSFSGARSILHSPFSRVRANEDPGLPPPFLTPSERTRKRSLHTGSPSSAQTTSRTLGVDSSRKKPPATDSHAGRSQARRGRNSAAQSSPLARVVAGRLLSSPTKRRGATPMRSPSLVASPHGTLRRCGEDGFVCERAFCLTCCK